MKTSFVIAMQETTFEAVARGSWEHRIVEISGLGYDGVEISVRHPEKTDIRKLQEWLQLNHLELAAVGTGQAFIDDGISITDPDSKVRQAATDHLKKCADLAGVFKSKIIIGLIRGKLDRNSDIQNRQWLYVKNAVEEICEYAQTRDVTILIEPLNRYECNFWNHADDVLAFIHALDCPNLRLLLDTFHMNIEENDILYTIQKSRAMIGHIHLADSNRHSPGYGHLDFRSIIRTLREIGYNGFLSGEVLPYPDIKTAMKKYIETVQRYIHE